MNVEMEVIEDVRGKIHKTPWGVNVLFSKAGSWRGGDYHPNDQHNIVLKGKVAVTVQQGLSEEDLLYRGLHGANAYIHTEPGFPHLFHFLEDTVMIEWWSGPFSCTYYPPFRKIVEESMKA